MKISKNTALGRIGIIFLVLLFVSSAGCIRQVQNTLSPSGSGQDAVTTAPMSPVQTPVSVSTGTAAVSSPGITVPETPAPSTASIAVPIYPDDWNRDVRNLSGRDGGSVTLPTENAWSSRLPLYTLNVAPNYDARAIEVNVTHGPLVIIFSATPQIQDPRISFADVTVRELPSKEIVAEERIDHFPQADMSSTTRTVESGGPDEKQIVIFREGAYHINVDGNQVSINLAVYTGDSPVVATAAPTEDDFA
jgi:hypothetical protein